MNTRGEFAVAGGLRAEPEEGLRKAAPAPGAEGPSCARNLNDKEKQMSLSKERKDDLERLCLRLRRDLVRLLYGIQTGHPGGSLSANHRK